MNKVPSIVKFMTPFPYSIDINAPISAAQKLMTKHVIRHIPIRSEDKKVVGVISERDINLAVSLTLGEVSASDITVGAVCSMDPYLVDTETPTTQALSHMVENEIGSALIMKGDTLAGIFTTTDACKALKQVLEQQAGIGRYIEPEIA